MLDIKLIRENPEMVAEMLARRQVGNDKVFEIYEKDRILREFMHESEKLRAAIKSLSSNITTYKKKNDAKKVKELSDESKKLGEIYAEKQKTVRNLKNEIDTLVKYLPNLPDPECPIGKSSQDNIILKTKSFNDTYSEVNRVPHWDIGASLGIVDLDRAAKISGSMFSLFKNAGAKLLRALTAWALDAHEDTFEEIRPPTLVRSSTLESTGHLPKFAEEAYHIERDDLWAIPTAEVPLTSYRKDEILKESELPVLLCAYSPCFRREAGAAGSDTRGLLRLHEFDKVEILAYCLKEQSNDIHNLLLSRAESLLISLKLDYRIVDLCTGDLGNSSMRTFDLEVYAPGCDKWLEVSSVSCFGDYQARRANIRVKRDSGKLEFVYTLNGSALAWPRIVAALLEVGRQEDGSVILPDVLGPYLNNRLRISQGGKLVAL